MRFDVFLSVKDGQWYWRAVGGNNQVVTTGGEGYTRRHDARRAVDRFLNHTFTPTKARRWMATGAGLRCVVGR